MGNTVLRLDLIEQRRYLTDFEQAVRDASRYLSRYIEHFGQAAVGARYAIAAKITFHVGDRGRVDISTSPITESRPRRPGEQTVARACLGTDEQYDLFVPVSGSDRDPEQSKLFTEDGRALG